jgi:hypothetical protein
MTIALDTGETFEDGAEYMMHAYKLNPEKEEKVAGGNVPPLPIAPSGPLQGPGEPNGNWWIRDPSGKPIDRMPPLKTYPEDYGKRLGSKEEETKVAGDMKGLGLNQPGAIKMIHDPRKPATPAPRSPATGPMHDLNTYEGLPNLTDWRPGFMPRTSDENPSGDWPLGPTSPGKGDLPLPTFKSLGVHMDEETIKKGIEESWKAFKGINSLANEKAFQDWLDAMPTGGKIEDRRNEPPYDPLETKDESKLPHK